MRRVHVCHCCGLDLTRAPVDCATIPGLAVVRCAGCGTAVSLRKAGPGPASPWAVMFSAVFLIVQLVAAAVTIFGAAAIVRAIPGELSDLFALAFGFRRDFAMSALDAKGNASLEAWFAHSGYRLISLVCVGILSGAWISSGLSHWPRWRAWLGWLCAVLLVITFDPVAGEISWRIGMMMRTGSESLPADWARFRADVAMALLVSVMAPLGYPIGAAIRRGGRLRRSRRWKRALARGRKGRRS